MEMDVLPKPCRLKEAIHPDIVRPRHLTHEVTTCGHKVLMKNCENIATIGLKPRDVHLEHRLKLKDVI